MGEGELDRLNEYLQIEFVTRACLNITFPLTIANRFIMCSNLTMSTPINSTRIGNFTQTFFLFSSFTARFGFLSFISFLVDCSIKPQKQTVSELCNCFYFYTPSSEQIVWRKSKRDADAANSSNRTEQRRGGGGKFYRESWEKKYSTISSISRTIWLSTTESDESEGGKKFIIEL